MARALQVAVLLASLLGAAAALLREQSLLKKRAAKGLAVAKLRLRPGGQGHDHSADAEELRAQEADADDDADDDEDDDRSDADASPQPQPQAHQLLAVADGAAAYSWGTAVSAPSPEQAICTDSPPGWRSQTKATCKAYAERGWCTPTGEKGPNWPAENGKFAEWAPKEGEFANVSARKACCLCGGGTKVKIAVAASGQDRCAQGNEIHSEVVCRAAALSIGAVFDRAARWPVGQPSGCHTDADRKTVWLNMHPSGTPRQQYSALCAVAVSRRVYGEEHSELKESKAVDSAQADQSSGDQDDDDDDDTKSSSDPKEAQYRRRKERLQQKVEQAHKELVANMQRRVQIGVDLHHLQDDKGSAQEIESNVRAVANETQSPALGDFLGDMWKEMRMFAGPFYQERLQEELYQLRKKEPALQDRYDEAKHQLLDLERQANG